MTSEIRFAEHDAEFSFRQDKSVFLVRTEVGNGPARVQVLETREQEETQMEPEGEA